MSDCGDFMNGLTHILNAARAVLSYGKDSFVREPVFLVGVPLVII